MPKSKADPGYTDVPAFVAASPELQAAIAALLDAAPRDEDGMVTLYPARDAWVPGWPRDRQYQATPRDAAHLLAHIPPPAYTTAEAAAAGRLLTD